MKKLIYLAMTMAFLLSSCDEEVIELPAIVIQAGEINLDAPYGEFTVINKGTNDTILINDSISRPTLNAKHGNFIFIHFEPKEEYADKKFHTVYTLQDSTLIEDKTDHEFLVKDTIAVDHTISLFAKPVDVDASLWHCEFTLRINP